MPRVEITNKFFKHEDVINICEFFKGGEHRLMIEDLQKNGLELVILRPDLSNIWKWADGHSAVPIGATFGFVNKKEIIKKRSDINFLVFSEKSNDIMSMNVWEIQDSLSKNEGDEYFNLYLCKVDPLTGAIYQGDKIGLEEAYDLLRIEG